MQKFHPTTSADEARLLTVQCLNAIASGWSIIYMRPAKISGLAGNQTLEPDLDRMVADAADLAARLTQACDVRLQGENTTGNTYEKQVVKFNEDGTIERIDQ